MRHVVRSVFILLLTASLRAQTAPDATIGGALRSLAARAGVVFVGQVVKVEPKAGVVEVTFRVDHAVQGAAGASYTLREWAGLWANGQPRYLPGQRVMVFLHAPGASGLSTPVDGMEGVLPLMVTTAESAPMLDLRWLATRVQRKVGTPIVAATVSVDAAVAALRSGKDPELLRFPVTAKPQPVLPVRILPGAGDASELPVERAPEIVLQTVVHDVR